MNPLLHHSNNPIERTMKTRIPILTASVAMLACLSTLNPQLSAAPLGTAFSYQGRLAEGGTNATGIFDLRFAIPPTAPPSWPP